MFKWFEVKIGVLFVSYEFDCMVSVWVLNVYFVNIVLDVVDK